jgi:hypothetical protein
MNNLTNIEKLYFMNKAMEKVAKKRETSEYLQKLTKDELHGIIVYEYHELIKEELYKRANQKGHPLMDALFYVSLPTR